MKDKYISLNRSIIFSKKTESTNLLIPSIPFTSLWAILKICSIGTAFLNEIVIGKDITTPSKILDNLRERIIVSLKQKNVGGENRDGMDIGLLCFNADNSSVDFSGANNPLWIISNGKLTEIKGNKQPIAFHEGPSSPFTQHTIALNKVSPLLRDRKSVV